MKSVAVFRTISEDELMEFMKESNMVPTEKYQIQEWTKLKCDNVLFDSDVDDWNDQKVFNERVIGKSKLVIVVEDSKGDKFGGYVDATLNGEWDSIGKSYNYDKKSFLFSLQSNGRLPGPMKYDCIREGGAEIVLFKHDSNKWPMIDFGDCDLRICKYPIRNESCCNYNTPQFDFHGIKYPLSEYVKDKFGDPRFTTKRITVIQMK